MIHARRLAVLLFAFAVLGGLAACGSDDDDGIVASTTEAGATGAKEAKDTGKKPAAPATPTIVVRDGKPVGGAAELEYDAGDEVRFEVRSNTADEVHVHGYDVSEEVPAGGSATLSFPAEIEGIFEVELHGSEELIAELRVNP